MFRELSQKTRAHIVSQGEIEFVPIVKWKSFEVLSTFIKHEIVFQHNSKKQDRIGSFYLTIDENCCFEMTKIRFTEKSGVPLRLFMYELILKCAIKEAKFNSAPRLVAQCDDPLFVEALLKLQFDVQQIEQLTEPAPLYHGEKKLAQGKVHPLVNFSKGVGSL